MSDDMVLIIARILAVVTYISLSFWCTLLWRKAPCLRKWVLSGWSGWRLQDPMDKKVDEMVTATRAQRRGKFVVVSSAAVSLFLLVDSVTMFGGTWLSVDHGRLRRTLFDQFRCLEVIVSAVGIAIVCVGHNGWFKKDVCELANWRKWRWHPP